MCYPNTLDTYNNPTKTGLPNCIFLKVQLAPTMGPCKTYSNLKLNLSEVTISSGVIVGGKHGKKGDGGEP